MSSAPELTGSGSRTLVEMPSGALPGQVERAYGTIYQYRGGVTLRSKRRRVGVMSGDKKDAAVSRWATGFHELDIRSWRSSIRVWKYPLDTSIYACARS